MSKMITDNGVWFCSAPCVISPSLRLRNRLVERPVSESALAMFSSRVKRSELFMARDPMSAGEDLRQPLGVSEDQLVLVARVDQDVLGLEDLLERAEQKRRDVATG